MHDKPDPASNPASVAPDAPLESLLDELSRRDPAEAPAAADAVALRLEEELAVASNGPHGMETASPEA